MKKINEILKTKNLLHLMSFFVCAITVANVNTTCGFMAHQEKMPESAKKLRKF